MTETAGLGLILSKLFRISHDKPTGHITQDHPYHSYTVWHPGHPWADPTTLHFSLRTAAAPGTPTAICQLFYSTFMRLFAFTLPVTSLFRFWDLLLADANRPDMAEGKPARHALIDLAFGGGGGGLRIWNRQKHRYELEKSSKFQISSQRCLPYPALSCLILPSDG